MATYVFETMTAAHAGSYDPAEDLVVFGTPGPRLRDQVLVIGADTFPGEHTSGPAPRKAPDTSPAGLERLRQAELRRARKSERQKKGMHHG